MILLIISCHMLISLLNREEASTASVWDEKTAAEKAAYYCHEILLACLLLTWITQKCMSGFQSHFPRGLHAAGREGFSNRDGGSHPHLKANLHTKQYCFSVLTSKGGANIFVVMGIILWSLYFIAFLNFFNA